MQLKNCNSLLPHILINAHSNHKCHYIIHVHVQVGACVVSPEHKIVGIGYNGMPNGCSDDELPWNRTAESRLDTKYPYGKRKGRNGRIGREEVGGEMYGRVCVFPSAFFSIYSLIFLSPSLIQYAMLN